MILGDVWSVHLPYVEHYLCLAPRAKFVVLERAREDVVRSFDEWTSRESFVDKQGEHYSFNHWQPKANRAADEKVSMYDKSFPTYPEAKSKREAIGMYWDEYATESRRLVNLYPDNVAIFQFPEIFTNMEMQKKMLTFVGIPEKLQVLGELKRVNSKAYRDKREKKIAAMRKEKAGAASSSSDQNDGKKLKRESVDSEYDEKKLKRREPIDSV